MNGIKVGLALFAILTTGCSDTRAGGASLSNSPTPGPDAESLQSTSGWFNDTFTRLNTPVSGTGFQGQNCVWFDRDDLVFVKAGWVNVSWTSEDPTKDVMTLTVEGEEERTVTGPSPLSLEILDLRRSESGLAGLLLFLGTENSAEVRVTMSMHWSFQYEGIHPLAYKEAGCG